MKFIPLILLCASSFVMADEIIVSGLYTKHLKVESDTYQYNEGVGKNYGIGFNKTLHEGYKAGVGAIVYKDSYYKAAGSVYVYKEFSTNTEVETGIILKVGYLNGSGYNSVVAMPSPFVRYNGWKAEMLYLPKTNKTGVVSVLIGKEF